MKSVFFIILCTAALAVTSTVANAISLPDSCVAVSDTLTVQFQPHDGLRGGYLTGDVDQKLTVLYLGGQQWLLVNDTIYGVILDNPAVGVIRYFSVRHCCRRSVIRFARWHFPTRKLAFRDEAPSEASRN